MEENTRRSTGNKILLVFIMLLILALLGLLVGYYLRKNDDNTTKDVKIKNVTCNDNECNETFNGIEVKSASNTENGISFTINGYDVSKMIRHLYIKNYTIYDDIVLVHASDNVGGTSEFYIFNSKGEKLYSVNLFENKLFFTEYEIKEGKIVVKSNFVDSESQSPAIEESILDMSCSEIDEYKDLESEVDYEIEYLGNSKLSELKKIGSKKLSENDLYSYFKERCERNTLDNTRYFQLRDDVTITQYELQLKNNVATLYGQDNKVYKYGKVIDEKYVVFNVADENRFDDSYDYYNAPILVVEDDDKITLLPDQKLYRLDTLSTKETKYRYSEYTKQCYESPSSDICPTDKVIEIFNIYDDIKAAFYSGNLYETGMIYQGSYIIDNNKISFVTEEVSDDDGQTYKVVNGKDKIKKEFLKVNNKVLADVNLKDENATSYTIREISKDKLELIK